MDLLADNDAGAKFANNVGIISTKGKNGYNIMAAEWAHQVSYEPGLIMISLRPSRETHKNIIESKEFGLSIAAEDQNVLSSIAGKYHGNEIDKIKSLKEAGFKFF